MIELIAAVAGASITVAAMGAMGFSRRNDEARDAVVRLTSAVESISVQLQILHTDIKDERKETIGGIDLAVCRLRTPSNCDPQSSAVYAAVGAAAGWIGGLLVPTKP